MIPKFQKEILKILIKADRIDLAAVLIELFEDTDSDYEEDPEGPVEPYEEFNEGNVSEDEYEFAIDDEGFHYLL